MRIGNVPRLLLVQIKNDLIFSDWEVTNKDFRKYRIDLLKKYPQMQDFLIEEFFDFDKIWPNWIDLMSWGEVENNMSLEFIAANIKTKTTVMDGIGSQEKIINELNRAKSNGLPYTHVGFGIYPIAYLRFIDCARIVKKFDPQIITIAGNIGSLVDETKNYVDYVFLGDGVKSLRQLFGENVNDPYKVNLSLSRQNNYKRVEMVNIVTKLGCPERCDFCITTKLFDNRIIKPFVTPKQVYDAVTELNEKTKKIVTITVCEPNMLLFRQWWYELFELFEDCKDPIGMAGAATMSSIKKFNFKRIANSSLHFSVFNIGIESFTKKYIKNDGFEQMKKVVDSLRNIGIGVIGTFIVGFEHHTRESVMEEIKLLAKLDCLHHGVQNLKAFPKTQLWDKLKRENKLIEVPYDFYSLPGFQAFKHPNFKIGFEDMLPLMLDIYRYILQECGPEILNCKKIYENKQKPFKHFSDSANDCRIISKNLFSSWKKYLNPSEKQIENYLKKLE